MPRFNVIDPEKFIQFLPHGSGINCDWSYTKRADGKITFKNSFHAMSEHGYYDGYMPFQFTVYPLPNESFSISHIRCNENKRKSFYGLSEYLEDTIHYAVSQISLKDVLNSNMNLTKRKKPFPKEVKLFAQYRKLLRIELKKRGIHSGRDYDRLFLSHTNAVIRIKFFACDRAKLLTILKFLVPSPNECIRSIEGTILSPGSLAVYFRRNRINLCTLEEALIHLNERRKR